MSLCILADGYEMMMMVMMMMSNFGYFIFMNRYIPDQKPAIIEIKKRKKNRVLIFFRSDTFLRRFFIKNQKSRRSTAMITTTVGGRKRSWRLVLTRWDALAPSRLPLYRYQVGEAGVEIGKMSEWKWVKWLLFSSWIFLELLYVLALSFNLNAI